ncbi:hypothetical protein NL676_030958 [Syzygium grande]|nr:hypothetical protein NL676_030958 [Syzygium grande]
MVAFINSISCGRHGPELKLCLHQLMAEEQTVVMFTSAIPCHQWTLPDNRTGFVIMYSFTFFFTNFGPNATTFVVRAESFPARLNWTCHGISVAAGKTGS